MARTNDLYNEVMEYAKQYKVIKIQATRYMINKMRKMVTDFYEYAKVDYELGLTTELEFHRAENTYKTFLNTLEYATVK